MKFLSRLIHFFLNMHLTEDFLLRDKVTIVEATSSCSCEIWIERSVTFFLILFHDEVAVRNAASPRPPPEKMRAESWNVLSAPLYSYLSYTQQSKLEKKVRQLKEKSKEVALEHETFLGPCHAGLALEREMWKISPSNYWNCCAFIIDRAVGAL